MVWKSVYGWEGYYSVSNTGLIRSEKRSIKRKNGGRGTTQTLKERLMSLVPNGKGYFAFPAMKNGKRKTLDVHRVVFEAHVRPLNKEEHVHHIDSNRQNNHVSNLTAMSGYDHRCLTQKEIKDKCALADFLTILFISNNI